jgi:hypothetical protein
MTNVDERAAFEKWVSTFKDADLTPANKESIFERSYTYESDQTEAAWDGWQAARAESAKELAEKDAEMSEDEVVEIMAKGMEPTYSDTYSSRELIEKALRALSGNGYKVVRK